MQKIEVDVKNIKSNELIEQLEALNKKNVIVALHLETKIFHFGEVRISPRTMIINKQMTSSDKACIPHWIWKATQDCYGREINDKLFIITANSEEEYYQKYSHSDIGVKTRKSIEADDYSGISHYDSASDRGW